MKLSTRILLPLLATVVVVMLAYAWWAQAQREANVEAEARREVVAYATALALALEGAVREAEGGNVQDVIDRISREPAVYAVLVYDRSAATRRCRPAVQGICRPRIPRPRAARRCRALPGAAEGEESRVSASSSRGDRPP